MLEPSRQPSLDRAMLRASEAVLQGLSDRECAPVWLHLGALVSHAAHLTLVQRSAALRVQLDQLSRLHPQLASLPAFAETMSDQDEGAVSAHWRAHRLFAAGAELALYSYPLGDLYQALSEEARKQRALCQTPWWVTELLLHLSYDRALEQWPAPRIVDPACGTGHILVESLARTLVELGDVEQALGCVRGVDLDPYAVLVARYRLLAFARMSLPSGDLTQLAELPLSVACADSLLAEDEPLLERGQYEVVIANPPYIVPPNEAMRSAVRARWPEVCHAKYSLALPFTALMTELARPGGYVAQITTNAWMKREYGKPFVTDYLTQYELLWVINSAGAYIPGHGTPTCILVHRNLPATNKPVLSVLAKRGEPKTPEEPSEGLVWSSIRRAVYDVECRERRERAVWAPLRQSLATAAVGAAPSEQTLLNLEVAP